MIVLDLSILNQKGTPMFYSDIFANRPAFGVVGRIFISTDTSQIFRDTGTTWSLIADGTGVTTNIYNSDGTLTAARTLNTAGHNLTFEGGSNTLRFRMSADNNIPRILSFATSDVARWAIRIDGNETGSNSGANFAIRRYNDAGTFIDAPLEINRANGRSQFTNTETATASGWYNGISSVSNVTIPANITFDNGGGAGSIGGQCFQYFNGNARFQPDTTPSNINARNIVSFVNNGSTITIDQGSQGQIRTFSAISGGIFTYNSNAGTITHAAGLQIYDPARVFTSTVTQVNNYYGILINNASARTALTYTNRWGVYQEGSLDNNYFAGKVLIGTSVVGTEALKVTGTASISSSITANSFVKSGATSSQILAGDGSVITAGSGITISGGTISAAAGGNNIYNTDGTLTANRTLTQGGFNLTFTGSTFTNRFTAAGRLLLGTTTESTYILDVVGDQRASGAMTAQFGNFGSNTGNANFAIFCSGRLRVTNNLESSSSCGFAGTGVIGGVGFGTALNNGIFAGATATTFIYPLGNSTSAFIGSRLSSVRNFLGTAAKPAIYEFTVNTDTGVITTIDNIISNPNFAFLQIRAGYITTNTSSGEVMAVVRNAGTIDDANARVFTYIGNDIRPIYNTGLSNATMRGYYYNPTLNVNPLVHIAFENTTGNVLLGTTSGSVGIGANANINPSSILHITSTTKGFLPPRMTTAQKTAIATPAAGLVVYDTDLAKLCVYTTAWETITSV